MPDPGNLIVSCRSCQIPAEMFRNHCMVLAVFVKTGDLAPVDTVIASPLPVKHVGIDAADPEPLIINPAPGTFKEPAGTPVVIPCPERVTGNIECSELITEFREGRR